MKFVDEYRDQPTAEAYARAIQRVTSQGWCVMEICGGQTHAIVKFGIDTLLPPSLTLLHGPGCPVCVTPLEIIDRAVALARRPAVILCSFGDMLRVPGSDADLLSVKASGGDVRTVYSPLDALRVARDNPEKEVVFLAVGFETTAPANALVVLQAEAQEVRNFSMLVAHVLVPPAIEAILDSPETRINAFLAAGHVCTITGFREYERIARRFRVPIVVTGFEPADILQGVFMAVRQLESGRAEVENQYSRVVQREGNIHAQAVLERVFHVVDRKWRGLGQIPKSGLDLAPRYSAFDAALRFGLATLQVSEPSECISGLVLQGIKKPHECSAFCNPCTPERPLGALMVSSEGACAAYYRYRRTAPAITFPPTSP